MMTLSKLSALPYKAQDIIERIAFTSFDGRQRTPLSGDDARDKEDFIEFLNSAMDNQGKHVLQAFTTITLGDNTVAVIDDIYEEGVVIRYGLKQDASQLADDTDTVLTSSKTNLDKQPQPAVKNIQPHPNSKTVFIPFRTQRGDAFERLYFLGAEAQIKQGIFDDIVDRLLPTNEKHDFKVIKTQFITKNMIRIYIKSDTALPQNEAGYAYRFVLTQANANQHAAKIDLLKLSMQVEQVWGDVEPKLNKLPYVAKVIHTTKKYGLLSALEIFKRFPEPKSSNANQSEKKQSNQEAETAKSASIIEKRYYTLRQLKSNTDPMTGEVDIYIHDDTPGSVWATSLQAGDSIIIDSHYEETIKNMTLGQPLFICDETSMPSVAAVLERWDVDSVPIVISLTNDQADFAYFDDMVLPETLKDKLKIQYINTKDTDNVANAVIDIIKQHDKNIDCAWGAIGKADFRPIKNYLRETYGLKGKLNRVRAYWV